MLPHTCFVFSRWFMMKEEISIKNREEMGCSWRMMVVFCGGSEAMLRPYWRPWPSAGDCVGGWQWCMTIAVGWCPYGETKLLGGEERRRLVRRSDVIPLRGITRARQALRPSMRTSGPSEACLFCEGVAELRHGRTAAWLPRTEAWSISRCAPNSCSPPKAETGASSRSRSHPLKAR